MKLKPLAARFLPQSSNAAAVAVMLQRQLAQDQTPQNQTPQNQTPQNQIPQNQTPQNQTPQNQTALSYLLHNAEEARAGRRYLVAAAFYEEAIAAVSRVRSTAALVAASLHEEADPFGAPTTDLLLQCGRMYQEVSHFDEAERHYLRALNLVPDEPAVLRQLGSLYKKQRRFADAEHFYSRVLEFQPNDASAIAELQSLVTIAEGAREQHRLDRLEHTAKMARISSTTPSSPDDQRIDPSLYAKTREELFRDHHPAFVITRIGNHQKTRWGTGQTLRGIEALRGYVVSPVPCLYIEIYLDGELIYKKDLVVAPQPYERTNPDIRKYAYNAWVDFSKYPYGWHELVFNTVSVRGEAREAIDWRRERVILAEPLRDDFFQESDAVIPLLDPTADRSLEEEINGRPSVIHRASNRSFPGPIKNVAVLRTDQLGDMVISVPAFKKLRELLPEARITGLMSPATADLAVALGLFDEVIVLDFPEDAFQRQRVMDEPTQEALIRRLAEYKFDLAIDLVVNGPSRRLLPMTGAAVTMGYHDDECRTLSLHSETWDFKSNNDFMHHSARITLMIKTLELWLDSGARIVKRKDLDRAVLQQYGIGEADEFVVLHAGSRIKFIQWPHYAELARLFVQNFNKKLVLIADDNALRVNLPQDALATGRLVYLSGKLPFDHFDALLSFCSVFVGNDSGPKHMASLRGAKVVSIHPARISATEWGQEQTGVIISRKVPCAGCGLYYDPEECAQDVACIKYISVSEVFNAMKMLLDEARVL